MGEALEVETITMGALADPSEISGDALTDLVHGEFVRWFGSDIAAKWSSYVEIANELRSSVASAKGRVHG